jgi:phosphoglycerate dehydrogenase-like enzyme
MALMLAAAKWIVPLDASLRRDDWSPRYEHTPIVLLRGKRALILGAGAIGRHIARMVAGMDMLPVLAGRTAREASGGNPEVRPITELRGLLPQADVLFVTLPLTDETRGLIGSSELALTPNRCILVNVGRGPVVEETALWNALRDGTLHAAGLDVWYNYPTDEPSRFATSPSEHPFRELPNVVMSPHRAGAPNTPETESLRMRALAELLNAAARGEPIPNRVDLELGY